MEPVALGEARLLVLEATVAALIAQLPPEPLQEVVGMLAYMASASEATDALSGGQGMSKDIRDWATRMLERVMVSRRVPSKGSPARET